MKDTEKTKKQLISELDDLRRKMNTAGSETLNLLEKMSDLSPVFKAYISVPGFCYKYLNKRYEAAFGRKCEDVLGKHISEVIGTENYENNRKYLEAAAKGEDILFEQHYALIDDKRWLRINYVPDKNAEGEISGIVVLGYDITELKETEDRYRMLVESSPMAIAVHSEGKVVFVNSEAVRLMGGRNYEDFLGKPIFEFVHPDYRAMAAERVKKIYDKKESVQMMEEKFITLDGRTIDVEVAGAIVDFRGKPASQLVFHDITQHKIAEKALREREQQYRSIFEGAAEGILVADIENGKLIFANPAICDMLGFSNEELMQMKFLDIHPAESRGYVLSEFKAQVGGEKVIAPNIPCRRKDGEIIIAEVATNKILYNDRECALGMFTDITERISMEFKLNQARQDWEDIFHAIGHPAIILDLEHGIVEANKAVLTATGLSAEEIRSKKCYEVFHNSEGTPRGCPMEELLASGSTAAIEMEMEAFDGHYLVACTPILTKKGNIEKVIHIATDITKIKKAEQAIKESEERLAQFMDSATDAFTVWNSEYRLTGLNLTAISYLPKGTKRREVLGKTYKEIMDYEISERLTKVVKSGFSDTFDDEIVMPNGDLRFFHIRAFKVADGLGIMMSDITAERRLAEQLRQSQKMESVGRLAGGVAHDFNNLLTTIIGTCSLAMEDLNEHDPIYSDFKEIAHSGERAADLTRQLLAFSRRQVLEPQAVNFNTIVENMEKMLRRIIGEDIVLATNFHPNLWNVKIDPNQFENCVMNLAVNARDALPSGGKIIIETENIELNGKYSEKRPEVKSGEYVMFAISDTGVGMAAEVQDKIFEPFFTTKDMGKGTGLGLSTVYGIVKQSGGHIYVYSEMDKGTTFKIYMPRCRGDAEKSYRETGTSEMPRGSETVIVIEDDEMVRKMAYRILKRQGYDAYRAQSGGDALALCNKMEKPADIIITDVVMPNMSGPEFVDIIRKNWPEVKILYMSGYTPNYIVHEGVLDPGIPYLQKPFDPVIFLRKVRNVLDGK